MGTPRFFAASLALLLLVAAELVSAEIYYTVPGPLDATARETATLRRVNPDGTGNVALNLPGVPSPQFPIFSRDGRFLAVTSFDLEFPLGFSQSVFQLDFQTGNLTRLFFFNDMPDNIGGGTVSFVPSAKAYSPNNTLMAVSLLQLPTNGSPLTASAGLQIHDLSTGLPVVFFDAMGLLDGRVTTGAGVDWSPDATTLIYPIGDFENVSFQPVTPLFVIDANTGAKMQITSPEEGLVSPFPIASFGQHDYAPTFSPNGVAIAYVRATQLFDSALPLTQNPVLSVSIRILSSAGDRSICDVDQAFQPAGLMVGGARWSPDGTRLVFDIGPRKLNNLEIPLLATDLTLAQTYSVGVTGNCADLQLVSLHPANQPEWNPAPEPGATWMLGAGISLLAWLRRRRNRRVL